MHSLSRGAGWAEQAAPKCAAHVFRYFPLNSQLPQAFCPHLAGSLSPKIPFSLKRRRGCIRAQWKEQIPERVLPAPLTPALLGAGFWSQRMQGTRVEGE